MKKLENLIDEVFDLGAKYYKKYQIYDKFGRNDFDLKQPVFVQIKFEDCLEEKEIDYNINSYNFDEDNPQPEVKKIVCKKCVKSFVYDEKQEELLDILLSYGAGNIEINRYDNGTQIGFMFKEEGYLFEDNIEVKSVISECNTEILTVGKEYYVALTDEKTENIFKKRKLLKIESNLRELNKRTDLYSGYRIYFEEFKNPIFVLTRGNVNVSEIILNRLDHAVVSSNKLIFVSCLLKKIGDEVHYSFEDKFLLDYLVEIKKEME